MFKCYQYTCPDVLHMRRRQKQIGYTSLIVQLLFWGGLWTVAQANNKPIDIETPAE